MYNDLMTSYTMIIDKMMIYRAHKQQCEIHSRPSTVQTNSHHKRFNKIHNPYLNTKLSHNKMDNPILSPMNQVSSPTQRHTHTNKNKKKTIKQESFPPPPPPTGILNECLKQPVLLRRRETKTKSVKKIVE